MRKFTVIALALVAAFMFVVPAMAVDVDFSGHYRVRGFFSDNMELNDDNGESDAAFDHRFRIQPVFKINDNLKLTVRFDGQDNRVWGDDSNIVKATRSSDAGPGADSEDIGLERVYADITFDMVSLRIGRMAAGFCGIKYCDSEGDADRVKVILNDIKPYYLDFTYQKSEENDYMGSSGDRDSDAYYLHGFYTSETLMAGLLWGYYDDSSESVDGSVSDDNAKRNYWLYDPYIKGTVGPISYMAEAQWKTGDYRTDADVSSNDMDYDSWRYIVDVAFDAGPGSVGVGYAHADGQEWDDSDYTRADGGGNDWEPLLILTHNYANSDLGGVGNLNSSNNDADGGDLFDIGDMGFDIYYLYGSYTPTENLTLSAIIGWAYADTTDITAAAEAASIDDEIGWEFDVGAKYQIMDNLAYDVKLGFFSPGDMVDDISPDSDDDCWSMLHTLMVTF